MDVTGLTDPQRRLLAFIVEHVAREGLAPSYEEMRTGIGLASRSGVHRLLNRLAERGYIERPNRQARCLLIRALPTEMVDTLLMAVPEAALLREVERRALYESDGTRGET